MGKLFTKIFTKENKKNASQCIVELYKQQGFLRMHKMPHFPCVLPEMKYMTYCMNDF